MKPTELQALQNAGNRINLTIREYLEEDKRKTVQRYFAVDKFGNGVSPVLDYNTLNHFLLGWINCVRFNNPQ